MLYANLMKLFSWWNKLIQIAFAQWEYGSPYPDTDLYHKLVAMLDINPMDITYDTFDE